MSDWKVSIEPDNGGCGSVIAVIVIIIIIAVISHSCGS